MFFSPFEQFELFVLFPISFKLINLSITNGIFFMFLVMALIINFIIVILHKTYIYSNIWQYFLETLYGSVFDLVKEHVGYLSKDFFLFIFTLFLFILGCNLTGMLPYSFTVTSHCSITLTLSASICLALFMIGLIIHGSNFFNSFLPQGTPLALAPLLIVIELISYTSHAVSLSIRLFANMMAGHALLKILAGFVWTMTGVGGILYISSIAPLMVIIALTVLEFGIAALQAYVFTVLTCIYLKDTLYLH
jgi:F-type H+-transporting ATPase subunit a